MSIVNLIKPKWSSEEKVSATVEAGKNLDNAHKFAEIASRSIHFANREDHDDFIETFVAVYLQKKIER